MTHEPIHHLLSAKDLPPESIEYLFSRTEAFKRMRGILPADEKALDRETVTNIFWEASTRTRVSFQMAAWRMGARVVNIAPSTSSVTKGETLDDTIATLRALGCRYFVIRHATSGEPARLAMNAGREAHVLNAGDGTNEHPSQALLDAFTIRERKKSFNGLQVAILGDILRSRVARSNLHLLSQLGAKCRVSGPAGLLPERLDVPQGTIVKTADEAIRGADVVMVLRLQKEREGKIVVDEADYRKNFSLTPQRLELAHPDAIVLHPGPINRGIEIDSSVADGPRSMILRQVENGLFMRMAIFELLRGEER
ncbi:MAG TPA: aspartate carbamoyltransferase catalytic subunit [Bdellovibrionota bacterium]|nr:aspartate carbamoyltransferase catalytic subunit [Bdellovibrionota bacterium]